MPNPSRLRRASLKRDLAVRLRRDCTEAERKFWSILRRRQLAGVRFRRQQPIGPYIADFYCAAAKLVVELDGDQHGAEGAVLHDEKRSAWLKAQGISVLRFPNRDVFQNPQGIVDAIVHFFELHRVPLPPSP